MKYIFVESIRRLIQILFSAEIFDFSVLRTARTFFYRLVFDIGENPTIGRNVRLYRVHGLKQGKIKIGSNIGGNSIIGVGSVVTNDIPANVIVAGNTAKIIKKV